MTEDAYPDFIISACENVEIENVNAAVALCGTRRSVCDEITVYVDVIKIGGAETYGAAPEIGVCREGCENVIIVFSSLGEYRFCNFKFLYGVRWSKRGRKEYG